MGTIGVSRKPQQEVVILAAEETGAVDAITLKREKPGILRDGLNSRCTDDLLVNCGQPPHILTMTPKIKIEADTGHQDVALSRWEDEGGSSISFANKPGPKIRKTATLDQRRG